MMEPYRQLSDLEAVVKGFESCTTGKDDFTHASHLTVAVFYLFHSDEREAIARMRTGLLRFLNHHGVGQVKYHETLTVFWIKMLRVYLLRFGARASLVDITNQTVEQFSNSRLVADYYSDEVLKSAEARSEWIEPDLKPLSSTLTPFRHNRVTSKGIV